jgi:hypothetical protein
MPIIRRNRVQDVSLFSAGVFREKKIENLETAIKIWVKLRRGGNETKIMQDTEAYRGTMCGYFRKKKLFSRVIRTVHV